MRRPIRTKERYILDSLVSIFKGGHWVEDSVESLVSPSQGETPKNGGGGVPGLENGYGDRTETAGNYLTVVGSQKYEQGGFEDELVCAIDELKTVVVGDGRGAESHVVKTFFDGVVQIPVDPDRYGKSARKVNVEEVLCYAIDSPLLLVGNGERVKQARAWLERTKSRREVTELP
jgi:hypothetical protein